MIYKGPNAATKWFRKPTCGFCQGQMFGMRGAYFTDDKSCRNISRKVPYDFENDLQMAVIYLKALEGDLRTEIRRAKKRMGL